MRRQGRVAERTAGRLPVGVDTIGQAVKWLFETHPREVRVSVAATPARESVADPGHANEEELRGEQPSPLVDLFDRRKQRMPPNKLAVSDHVGITETRKRYECRT